MDKKHFQLPLQQLPPQSNYLTFYTPQTTVMKPQAFFQAKPVPNQQLFKAQQQQKNLSAVLQSQQNTLFLMKKQQENSSLIRNMTQMASNQGDSRILSRRENGLNTQRESLSGKNELWNGKSNGSVSERTTLEKKPCGNKGNNNANDNDDRHYNKENVNTLNLMKEQKPKSSNVTQRLEHFLMPNAGKNKKEPNERHISCITSQNDEEEEENPFDKKPKTTLLDNFLKPKPGQNKKEPKQLHISYTITQNYDETPQNKNSKESENNSSKKKNYSHKKAKINLLDQKFEISRRIADFSSSKQASKDQNNSLINSYNFENFLKELKSQKSELFGLKEETKGLKEKVFLLETQLQESDRRKKLDELSDLLSKASIESRMIRKQTKNRELKKNNFTMETELLEKKKNELNFEMNHMGNKLNPLMNQIGRNRNLMDPNGKTRNICGFNSERDHFEKRGEEVDVSDKTVKNQRKESGLKKQMKSQIEFKKLLQKTDISRFVEKVGSSNGNSNKTSDISEGLQTLKTRFKKFLDNYNTRRNSEGK